MTSDRRAFDSAGGPRSLPHCAYPRARDVAQHGLHVLPELLPRVDFAQAHPYRSRQYTPIAAKRLAPTQVLEMARVVATSFARREPMARHLQPPKYPPAGLLKARHTDPFGSEPFGLWNTETLLYWFIRLLFLTDPASPRPAIQVNTEALAQSLATVDPTGQVIGAALNEPMPPLDVQPELRRDDPFLSAVLMFVEPVLTLLSTQDAAALMALCTQYPAFRVAYAQRKVGHHFMVARSDALAKAHTFELVAATAAHYQALGYAFVVVEATNQWTGAACELLGGVRVHFAPYQAQATVPQSVEPLAGTVTSRNGFLSDKDSGIMFYVIRLS
ncbi:MAG: hypothetical protein ACREX9_09545 [Gammaproteobacteria bacterium]